MIQDGVDVVDDVGPPPDVPLEEGFAVVQNMFGVVQHDRAALRTRIGATGVLRVLSVERPLGRTRGRFKGWTSIGDGYLEGGIGDIAVPLVVQLDSFVE